MTRKARQSIDYAISLMGGPSATARQFGITRQAVQRWRYKGVSAERAVDIEKATEKRVRREDLRPDLYDAA